MNAEPVSNVSPAPERKLPGEDWEHHDLYRRVREAVGSLPVYFRTETRISGIMATDLHNLNTVLGATIEEQVVRALNLTRSTWDPEGRYALYGFVRQPQTFPDVLLRRIADRPLVAAFDRGQASSDGGAVLLKAAERAYGLVRGLAGCLADRRDPGKVRHTSEDLIGQRIFGIACGHPDGNDADELAEDPIHKLSTVIEN